AAPAAKQFDIGLSNVYAPESGRVRLGTQPDHTTLALLDHRSNVLRTEAPTDVALLPRSQRYQIRQVQHVDGCGTSGARKPAANHPAPSNLFGRYAMPETLGEDGKRERRPRGGPELAEASRPGAGGPTDDTGESTAAASRISFTVPEWQKSIEATANLFAASLRDALKLAASSLHDQATFMKTLADSKTPSELLKCHLDFAEQSCSKLFGEGWKMLDRLRHSHRSSVS
uniref:hypothetical protein n=1 Tax=Bradyrhizobium yuanmingense TaxID=108015 RepID=UPI001FCC75C5